MKRPLALVVLWLALAAAAGAVTGKHAKLVEQDPFRTKGASCGVCHSTHSGKGLRMWVVPTASMTATGKDLCGSSALCYSCHDGTVTKVGKDFFDYTETGMDKLDKRHSSHPVNVPMGPDMRHPAWATFFTGTVGANTYTDVLTCGTCHDPHNDGKYPLYLRGNPKDGSFCVECHTNK